MRTPPVVSNESNMTDAEKRAADDEAETQRFLSRQRAKRDSWGGRPW
jgi:hypothetical protein